MKNRLPVWFRQDIPDGATLRVTRLLSNLNIHTVCKEAQCPNLSHCFSNLKFTFIILGDTCTRECRFCAVEKTKDRPLNLDNDEPYRIAGLVRELGLNYTVITSVTRDDLDDGGAGVFAKTINLLKDIDSDIVIEVLIPDFSGSIAGLKKIVQAFPSVVGHNIETVRRLYKEVRPQSNYQLSLDVLKTIKRLNPALLTKSSLMLGMGEDESEVIEAMEDLRRADCDILTLGQYLAPSVNHYPVKEFICLEQLSRYQSIGLSMGFKEVLSGPKVRSSYQAQELYNNLKKRLAPFAKKAPDPFCYV